MRSSLHYAILGLVVTLLITSGCRMYGNQTSRSLLQQSIEETVSLVDREGAVWLQDVAKLTGAAELNSNLKPFADQAEALALKHSALIERLEHLGTEIANTSIITDNPGARWLGPDRYRKLHRTYGSMISERQRLVHHQITLAHDLGISLGLSEPAQVREAGRYQIVPHHYHHVSQPTTLNDVLAQLGEVAVN